MDIIKSQVTENIADKYNDKDIFSSQLPDIDLYIDQVLTLIDNAVGENIPEGESVLTKTMINNYSRERLLKPVNGKKYSKEHILQMLIVYNLKQIMPIGDIKKLMTCLVPESNAEKTKAKDKSKAEKQAEIEAKLKDEKTIEIYDRFMQSKPEIKAIAKELSQSAVANVSEGETLTQSDLLLSAMRMICISNYLKLSAEAIVENYFAE